MLIFLLVLSSSTQAFSAIQNKAVETVSGSLPVMQAETYFETLGNLFATGALPEPVKLLNIMWSGRCFKKASPSEPINAGYLVQKVKTPDVGPIGSVNPAAPSYVATSVWKKGEGPDYFDHFSYSQAMGENFSFNEVSFKGMALQMTFDQTLSRMRVNGKYLVEELTDDHAPLGSEADVRCYYFVPEYK